MGPYAAGFSWELEKPNNMPETLQKETYHNEMVRMWEFLPCVSLCIHLNGVSHTCVAFVYVWMSVHLCGWGECACLCVWLQRTEECVWCPVASFPAYSLETGSPTEPDTQHFNDATWLASSCLSLLSTARVTGYEAMPSFYMGASDPNLGPHGYTVSILTHRAVSPAPPCCLFSNTCCFKFFL